MRVVRGRCWLEFGVATWKKSHASMVDDWVRRNCRHVDPERFGAGRYPQPLQHPPHRRRTDPVAEAEQLALDPLVAPALVLPRHLLDQHRDPGVSRRASSAAGIGPLPADQLPVPAQQRVRRHRPAASATVSGAAALGRRSPSGPPGQADEHQVEHPYSHKPAILPALGPLPQSYSQASIPMPRFGTQHPRHPHDQHGEPGIDLRPAAPGGIGPPLADKPPGPALQRIRRHQAAHPQRRGEQPGPGRRAPPGPPISVSGSAAEAPPPPAGAPAARHPSTLPTARAAPARRPGGRTSGRAFAQSPGLPT